VPRGGTKRPEPFGSGLEIRDPFAELLYLSRKMIGGVTPYVGSGTTRLGAF
jgi:hypothetical protein